MTPLLSARIDNDTKIKLVNKLDLTLLKPLNYSSWWLLILAQFRLN